MSGLHGMRALVTGAAQGIGRATAAALLQAGASVALWDWDGEQLETTAKALSVLGRVLPTVVDVSQGEAVRHAMDAVSQDFGGLDIAINNAGIMPEAPFLEMREDQWERVMSVNAKGAFLVCQAAARLMVHEEAQGGYRHIVTISSGSERFARVGSAHYCASKAAVVMLTRTMAMELAPYGILVNSIAPGLIDNPTLTDAYRASFVRTVPMGRIGQPEDVAAAVLMIVQSGCSYLTGQVIPVDGGVNAGRFGLPLSHDAGHAANQP